MANQATLTELRGRVAANADTSFSTTSFVTTAQVNQWINDYLSEIHYMLADSGEDYFRSVSPSIALVASQSLYDLPSDFYKARGVDLIDGNSNRYDVPRFMTHERNAYAGTTLAQKADTPSGYLYRVLGDKLEIIPTPTAAGSSLQVRYVRQFAPLEADTDRVDPSVPQGWEDYAALMATANYSAKEEGDPTYWFARAERKLAIIREGLKQRDQVGVLRVTDVYGRWGAQGAKARWPTT